METEISEMSWYIKGLNMFVTLPNGKNKSRTINPDNIIETIEYLESKNSVLCPDDKRKEFIAKYTTNNTINFHKDVSIPEFYRTEKDPIRITNALLFGTKYDESMHIDTAISIRNREIELQLNAIQDKHKAELELLRTKLQAQQEESILKLKAEMKEQKDSEINRLKDTYNSQIELFKQTKSKGNVEKGSIGQDKCIELLAKVYESEPIDIHNGDKQCDIYTDIYGIRVAWEVKNYTVPVANSQIEKFKRDIEINKDYNVGVLVSLNTHISNHYKGGNYLDFELFDNRCLIYINKLTSDGLQEEILKSLIPLFKYINSVKTLINGSESEYEKLHTKTQKIIDVINPLLSKFIQNLKDMKASINKLEELHSTFNKDITTIIDIISILN
jgi:hypothetical protein